MRLCFINNVLNEDFYPHLDRDGLHVYEAENGVELVTATIPQSAQDASLGDHWRKYGGIADQSSIHTSRPVPSSIIVRFNQEAFDYSDEDQEIMLRQLISELFSWVGKSKKSREEAIRFEIQGEEELPDETHHAIQSLVRQGWLTRTPDHEYMVNQYGEGHPQDKSGAPELELKRHFKAGQLPNDLADTSINRIYKYSQRLGHPPSELMKGAFDKELTAPYKAYRWGGGPRNPNPHKNTIGQATLTRAIGYHKQAFHGRRWPALEQAFLQRANTYSGIKGDYVKPRAMLFRYLNQLVEPWSEGMKLADGFVETLIKMLDMYEKRGLGGIGAGSIGYRYFDLAQQDMLRYLDRNNPELCQLYVSRVTNRSMNYYKGTYDKFMAGEIVLVPPRHEFADSMWMSKDNKYHYDTYQMQVVQGLAKKDPIPLMKQL